MPIDPKSIKWDTGAPDPAAIVWDEPRSESKRGFMQSMTPTGGLWHALLAPHRGVLDGAAGLVRGAGSIGATLLTPYDLLAGNTKTIGNPERRSAMDEAFQSLGADTDSFAYGAGKLGGEIAGTAGVGGVAANALRAVPGVASLAAPVLSAIESAGFTAGGKAGLAGLGARTAGGGVTGAAAAAAVNPDDAATGAGIGAVLPGVVKAAGKLGQITGNGAVNALGLATGVGAEPVRQALRAGATGNRKFIENMRGHVPLTDVLDDAKNALGAMRKARGDAYRSGMIPIKNDATVLQFSDLDKAIADAEGVVKYKGQVKNEKGAGAVQRMRDAVEEWKALAPADFHTPEGLDALKQKLASIVEGLPFEEKGARLAAGKIHAAAKKTLEDQAPEYADVMKGYSGASEQIKEIERALSLGNKASKDTAMRKLQSLMRNNVQTNYGNRLGLANTLEQQGGADLLPALAGQAMSSATPRSLAGQLGGTGAVIGSLMSGSPLPLLGLPFQSPRLIGEATYNAGNLLGKTGQAAYRLGVRNVNHLGYRVAPLVLSSGG